MGAELKAVDRLRVEASDLRWNCPRTWVARAARAPKGDPLLWGQDRLLSGLEATARRIGESRPPGTQIVVPSRLGWVGAVADALQSLVPDDCVVEAVPRPTERRMRGGAEPGVLARAHGGIVVVDPADLVDQPAGWCALKEAVAHGTVAPWRAEGDVPGLPRPARVSVVMVGEEPAFKKLREAEVRLDSLFPLRLVGTADLERDKRGVGILIRRLKEHLESAGLGAADVEGLQWLVEWAAGGKTRRGRVSLDLVQPAAILSEARALQPEGPLQSVALLQGLKVVNHRVAAGEDWARQRLDSGLLALETEGALVGVANGLMVYGSGARSYSMPGRIGCRIAIGREGLVNVEREARFSGNSFDKGIFTLASWLRSVFSVEAPLGLAALISFEQSHRKVDGDSATVPEAMALLSALSGLPCRQDVASSGALNPRGELLPIGSVNLKIHGWWESCRRAGLTGKQGVLIPRRNVGSVQVSSAIQEDVAAGRFHVWAADTIDQAAELLLGRSSGRLPQEGRFDSGSIYGRVNNRLARMSDLMHPNRRSSRTGRGAKRGASNRPNAAAKKEGASG